MSSVAATSTPLSHTQSSPLPTNANANDTSARSGLPESEPLSLSMTFFTTKDQRAYEHDRHRTKQKQTRDATLTRKSGAGTPIGSVGSRRTSTSWLPIPTFTGVGLAGWKAGKTTSGTTDDVTAVGAGEDWVETHGEIVRERGQVAFNVTTAGAGATREARLADLVVSVRKPSKVKARDLDFEFVPHVRSVIVLDDIIQTKDVPAAVEEPWECVGSEEERKETYANVVANARV